MELAYTCLPVFFSAANGTIALGLLSLDVETRGLPPPAPPPRVCGEVYLTLPYLKPAAGGELRMPHACFSLRMLEPPARACAVNAGVVCTRQPRTPPCSFKRTN